MSFFIDEELFIKKWCETIGDPDSTYEELASAIAHGLNVAYTQGVKEGMRRAGVSNATI